MNPDKKIIISGLLERVNASPYLIVIDYTGLKVKQFAELRNRLFAVGAGCVVAKNSYMRRAITDAGLPDIGENLTGQMAFITGSCEVFAAAKTIKNFTKEFKKPEMKMGLLGDLVLDAEKLQAIADIPSREAVLSQLLGTINEPATRIARVIKAKFSPEDDSETTDPQDEPEAAETAVTEPAATEPAAAEAPVETTE
ncbi:MAG: 50S ribosomal protein L10 [Akkermansiaceae bacterium]|nr:50S ribosomal protein L10 [Akkermansiaceae bacterium]MCF7733809.1 50S ribosomal protein L10 [Akkermansiaceae bacterium]